MIDPQDLIAAATSFYLSKKLKLIDNIFATHPFLNALRVPEEEEDDFTAWAMEERTKAGIIDPPRDKMYRGGNFPGGINITEDFQFTPKYRHINIELHKEDLVVHDEELDK